MRDVSRILSEADLIKLRALLSQADLPAVTDAHVFEEYPKILYAPDWLMCWRLWKEHPDPIVRKDSREKMRRCEVIVHDIETEEEYLQDGWRQDPVQLMIEAGEPNPRVPSGREGRRADRDLKAARAVELADLRRRYAELTGRKITEEPWEDASAEPVAPAGEPEPQVATPAPLPVSTPHAARQRPPAPAPVASAKRARVASAARQSTAARV